MIKKLFSEFFVEDDSLCFGYGQYAENVVKRKLLVGRNNNAYAAANRKIACTPFIAVRPGNGYFFALKTEVKQCRAESLNISLEACVAYVENLTYLVFYLECRAVSVKLLALIE